MSRPLELVVFNGYRPAKRLTDAELAAEYWSAAAEAALELAGELDETDAPLQAVTLRRFATHPHYDEVDQ